MHFLGIFKKIITKIIEFANLKLLIKLGSKTNLLISFKCETDFLWILVERLNVVVRISEGLLCKSQHLAE